MIVVRITKLARPGRMAGREGCLGSSRRAVTTVPGRTFSRQASQTLREGLPLLLANPIRVSIRNAGPGNSWQCPAPSASSLPQQLSLSVPDPLWRASRMCAEGDLPRAIASSTPVASMGWPCAGSRPRGAAMLASRSGSPAASGGRSHPRVSQTKMRTCPTPSRCPPGRGGLKGRQLRGDRATGELRQYWPRRFLALPTGIPSHDTFDRTVRGPQLKARPSCREPWMPCLSAAR